MAPLLRAGLFRVPAFAAGLGVQLAFFGGMQGFFLAFALWLQAGEHFSPLKAGLTAVAFSVGSFVLAPMAVPLAQRHGRRVLAGGALLMVAGIGGEALAAPHVGVNGSPWPVVPGLVVAGMGLSLLVIPLVNVVLAAVPADVAGGASGLFSTAQQLGGALGVALLGTVFFGYRGGHSFEAAMVHTAPYAMGAFALCGVLSLLLPRTAVSEEVLTEYLRKPARAGRRCLSTGGQPFLSRTSQLSRLRPGASHNGEMLIRDARAPRFPASGTSTGTRGRSSATSGCPRPPSSSRGRSGNSQRPDATACCGWQWTRTVRLPRFLWRFPSTGACTSSSCRPPRPAPAAAWAGPCWTTPRTGPGPAACPRSP